MYKSLRDFINILDREGELIKITHPISTDREICELTDRQAKSAGGGKALLFENSGYDFPVVTNMMGSMSRITKALRVDSLDQLTQNIDGFTYDMLRPRSSLWEKLSLLPSLAKMGGIFPSKSGQRGTCQQVIHQGDDLSLDMLPVLKCWPYDGGRFITLPLVTTVDPESGVQNLGMYRMQIFSPTSAGLHWHLHKTGERHYRKYKELGYSKMPVSIVLGGDPLYTYAATAPLPEGINEYLLAGYVRGKSVSLVKCITNELRVPSDADFIIEGYVDLTKEKVVEGPFGDHTGFYSLEDRYPTMEVTAITHRKDAIYPATIVGIPPQEDVYFAAATERIFLSPIRSVIAPEINDMWLPDEGVAHNIAIIDIKNEYLGQPLKVASSMWGAGQMMFNKIMLVTSGMSDVRNTKRLISALAHVDVNCGILISRGPADVLDHSSAQLGFGSKIAIDCTAKGDDKAAMPQLQQKCTLTSGVSGYSTQLLDKGVAALIIYTEPSCNYLTTAQTFISENKLENIKYVTIFDRALSGKNLATHIWYGSSNIDPQRDCTVADNTLYVDCRAKHLGQNGFSRRWPNVVTMDQETIDSIDSRWGDIMGGDDFIPSPSLYYQDMILSNGAEYSSDEQ